MIDRYLPYVKALAFIAIASLLVILWNQNRDLRGEVAGFKAVTATLGVDFKKVGDGYVAQGKVFKDQLDAIQQAQAAQGGELTEYMTKNGYKVDTIYAGMGKVDASVNDLLRTNVTPTTNGSFQDVKLTQNRGGLPPLTGVSLNYDATTLDPSKRLTGSWINNQETFKVSTIEWIKKDKSYAGTIRVSREVRENTPSGFRLLGTEEIPMKNATATFDESRFPTVAEPSRWTIMAGPVYDVNRMKWAPGAGFNYRVSKSFSVTGGVAGSGILLWGGYTFQK